MIVTREKLSSLREKPETVIVHCHGVFDIFHHGHLNYLTNAKKLGDILVVSLTNDPYVNKGKGRPIFNIQQRIEIVDALRCVDFTCISESLTCLGILECLKPNFYCKGTDVKGKELDPSTNIYLEIAELEKNGGKLVFIPSEPIQSTQILKYI